jgi:hypothetical protein
VTVSITERRSIASWFFGTFKIAPNFSISVTSVKNMEWLSEKARESSTSTIEGYTRVTQNTREIVDISY